MLPSLAQGDGIERTLKMGMHGGHYGDWKRAHNRPETTHKRSLVRWVVKDATNTPPKAGLRFLKARGIYEGRHGVLALAGGTIN
jgi:hypothetical protein